MSKRKRINKKKNDEKFLTREISGWPRFFAGMTVIVVLLGGLTWIYTFGYFESRNTHIYKKCLAQELLKTYTWEGSVRACLRDTVMKASAKHGLSSQLVWAVISAESNFNYRAISKRGAMGFMQLMPDTARELGVSDPFDPYQNIEAGTRYLKKMVNLFNGDFRLALAAYNAGPNKIKDTKSVPPIKETQEYVDKIMQALKTAS